MSKYLQELSDARELARKARQMREAIKASVRQNGGELSHRGVTLFLHDIPVRGYRVRPHMRTILSKRDR